MERFLEERCVSMWYASFLYIDTGLQNLCLLELIIKRMK